MWHFPDPLCCACGALIGAEELIGDRVDLIDEQPVIDFSHPVLWCSLYRVSKSAVFINPDISAGMLYVV